MIPELGFKSADRISLWENGKAFPSIANLIKLSLLYNAQVEELYKEFIEKMRKK